MSEYEPQSNSPDRPAGVASACAFVGFEPASGGYRPVDTHNALSGRDLRYVLTSYIDAGCTTVGGLVRRLAADGYTVWGRASKVVSDALRWEVRNGRVVRIRRGVYGINTIPRTTRHRILACARELLWSPHVVAIRRDVTLTGTRIPTPSPDRYWRDWTKARLVKSALPVLSGIAHASGDAVDCEEESTTQVGVHAFATGCQAVGRGLGP